MSWAPCGRENVLSPASKQNWHLGASRTRLPHPAATPKEGLTGKGGSGDLEAMAAPLRLSPVPAQQHSSLRADLGKLRLPWLVVYHVPATWMAALGPQTKSQHRTGGHEVGTVLLGAYSWYGAPPPPPNLGHFPGDRSLFCAREGLMGASRGASGWALGPGKPHEYYSIRFLPPASPTLGPTSWYRTEAVVHGTGDIIYHAPCDTCMKLEAQVWESVQVGTPAPCPTPIPGPQHLTSIYIPHYHRTPSLPPGSGCPCCWPLEPQEGPGDPQLIGRRSEVQVGAYSWHWRPLYGAEP